MENRTYRSIGHAIETLVTERFADVGTISAFAAMLDSSAIDMGMTADIDRTLTRDRRTEMRNSYQFLTELADAITEGVEVGERKRIEREDREERERRKKMTDHDRAWAKVS